MKTYGKIILMGEHSVVYGHKAIALPFKETFVEVKIEEHPFFALESSLYVGPLSEVKEELMGLRLLIEKLVAALALKPVLIYIDSSLPTSSGLGSSAATASAIVKGLYAYAGKPLKQEDLFEYVQFSEGIIHGVSSGIDTLITTTSNAYIYARDGEKTMLNIHIDAYLVVGLSGEKGQTSKAVNMVKHHVVNLDGRQEIEILGNVTTTFYQALQKRDLIGMANQMNIAGHALKRLGLETKKLSNMRSHAMDLGALASKLTGAGLGGCVLALTDSLKTARTIQKQWMSDGENAWVMSLLEV